MLCCKRYLFDLVYGNLFNMLLHNWKTQHNLKLYSPWFFSSIIMPWFTGIKSLYTAHFDSTSLCFSMVAYSFWDRSLDTFGMLGFFLLALLMLLLFLLVFLLFFFLAFLLSPWLPCNKCIGNVLNFIELSPIHCSWKWDISAVNNRTLFQCLQIKHTVLNISYPPGKIKSQTSKQEVSNVV